MLRPGEPRLTARPLRPVADVRLSLSERAHVTLALIALLIVVTLVYLPGLTGPFVFDDYPNIVNNPAIAVDSLNATQLGHAALSNEMGAFGRPFAKLSFALNYYLAGGFADAYWFKATNLFIHLVNTVLVFWLAQLLLARHQSYPSQHPLDVRSARWLPVIVAAVWSLHPLNLSTVLYVVQRMTSLASLFVLAGLIAFTYGRCLLQKQNPHGAKLMWIGLLGGTLMGFACKETAALLPLYALVIEFVFFRDAQQDRILRIPIRFYVFSFVLMGLLTLYWFFINPDLILDSYNIREFTLGERLLTESRVLWFYVNLLFFPVSNHFSLFHDDLSISMGLFSPWTTAFALSGLILGVIAALISRRKYPLLSFSIFWFLVGHSMESSFISLELVHEHRNYLPSFAPIAAGIYGMAFVLEHLKSKTIRIALSILAITVMALTTHVLAKAWANEQSLATFMLEHHQNSARTHAMVADLHLLKQKNIALALSHYKTAADLAPYETSYLIRMVVVSAFTAVDQAEAAPSAPVSSREKQVPHGFIKIRNDKGRVRFLLDPSIHDRISQQLQSQPVHARIKDRLSELTDCILTHPDYCGDLYDDAVNWYKLALENPRSNNSIRKALMLNLARLYLDRGDMKQAMEVAQRSEAIDPHHPALAIMRANIYFLANRLDDAEKTILSVKQSGLVVDKEDREQADKLLSMIRQQHQKSGVNSRN